MTDDHTNLEVSRRLAKVWPANAGEDGHVGWWARMNPGEPIEHHDCTCAEEFFAESDGLGQPIPARSVSELEAKIAEMEWFARIESIPNYDRKNALVGASLYKGDFLKDHRFAGDLGDTIVNALGAAVAEALEKAAGKAPETGKEAR